MQIVLASMKKLAAQNYHFFVNFGLSFFQGRLQYIRISTINVYLIIKKRHVNYINMEIFNYLLGVDISIRCHYLWLLRVWVSK